MIGEGASGPVLSGPLGEALDQTKDGTSQKIRYRIFNMRDLATQFRAHDQPVLFHAMQMLIEHLLGNWRHPPLEFTNPNWTILKLAQDRDSPLPLNQGDGALDHRFV